VDPSGKAGFNLDFSPLTGMPMDMDFAFFDWLKDYTQSLYGGAAAATVGGGMCMAAPPLFYLGMRNPEMVYTGFEILNDLYNPSMPPSNPYVQGYSGLKSIGEFLGQ